MLLALGVSHHTARLEQRERVSLVGERAGALLARLLGDERVGEAVVLSTCNRTEIYATAASAAVGAAALSAALSSVTGVDRRELAAMSYTLCGPAVARHLMRVAASLDSMVIGESEIQGQVRAALALAESAGSVAGQLRDVFRHALMVGKRVRRETGVGRGTASVSAAAVELALGALPDLNDRSVVLVGAGRVAEATAGALVASGVRGITVVNRSLDAAQRLAARFGGFGVPLDLLGAELRDADIAICSTDSPEPVLEAGDVLTATAGRAGRPLVLIDIAVPRDVSPEVRELPGVRLMDLDDLERVVQASLDDRRREAERAERIVEQELWRLRARGRDVRRGVRAPWAGLGGEAVLGGAVAS